MVSPVGLFLGDATDEGRWNRWARHMSMVLAGYAVAGGVLSFAGWAADVPRLTDWDGDGISIQPNATLTAVFAGLGVLLLLRGSRRASAAAGAVVTAIGGLTLFEHVSGFNLGIDDALMFGREWGRAGVLIPGRMGLPGATSWTVIGCALVLASSSRGRLRAAAPPVVLAAALIASLSIIGYVYGAGVLYTIPTMTIIALQTSTFVLAASIAVVLAVDDQGPMRLLADPGPAGTLTRRLLPAVFILPVALGLLRLAGQRAGLYDLAFGTAVHTLAQIAIFLVLVWWTARSISSQSEARARAEQFVATREHDLRTIFEGLTDGLVTIDPEWRFTYVNAEAERLLQKPRGLLLGQNISKVFPESIGSASQTELTRVFLHGAPVEFEDFNPRLERWFFNKAYLTPEGALTVLFQDITQKKESEIALQKSRALLESDLADSLALQELSVVLIHEDNVDALYDSLLAAAMRLARSRFASLQICEGDPVSGNVTGLRLLASRGFNERARTFWARVDLAAANSCSGALLKSERVEVSDVLASDLLKDTEDLQIYLDAGIRAVQTTPLVSRSGNVLGMLSTHWTEPHVCTDRERRVIDILVRQAADIIERRQQEEALRAADRRKDVFLMTLAHELRNPLAAVRGAVDVLKTLPIADPDVSRVRDITDRQTAVMAKLLDDLLDVGRIAQDRLHLRAEPVDLRSVLRNAVEINGPLVKECRHDLEVTVPPVPLPVLGDPIRLSQLVGNLVSNACRYTNPGGHIRVRLEQEGSEAVVTVQDSGIGIAGNELSNIFEMFSQLDTSLERSRGGLGIGLHLVRRLADLHSGRVEAHSEGPGLGSTFVVRLPVLEMSELPEELPRLSDEAVGQRRRRVLVVDDNVDAAEMLSVLLGLGNHETAVAHDGDDALALVDSFRPDTVLLDIGLPRVNGYDVCSRLRALPSGKQMTVIAVTGWGQDADRRRSSEAGFDHHLVKPIDFDLLQKLLG